MNVELLSGNGKSLRTSEREDFFDSTESLSQFLLTREPASMTLPFTSSVSILSFW